MENEKQLRRHKLLDIPVLGMVLAAAWAMFLSEVVFGLLGGLLSGIIAGFSVAANGGDLTEAAQSSPALYFTCAVGGIAVLLIHRQWFRPEFRGSFTTNHIQDRRQQWIIAAAMFLDLVTALTCSMLMGFRAPDAQVIGLSLMAGICEEAAFRGLALSVGMRHVRDGKGIVLAVAVSAVMFGLVHSANILSGADAAGTLMQIVYCLCLGIFNAAVYLRTGSLGSVIVFHTLHDIFAQCAEATAGGTVTGFSIEDLVVSVGLGLVLVAFAVVLLRGHTDDILAVWRERWSREEDPEK